MTRDVAERINATLLEYYFKIHASIDLVRESSDEVERKAYCRAAGMVLGHTLLDVLDPIYAEHPALKPDSLK